MASEVVELWTVKDVVRVLKMKKSWVYAHCESGELPHFRMGTHIRFDPKEIYAYLERCRQAKAKVISINSKKDQ